MNPRPLKEKKNLAPKYFGVDIDGTFFIDDQEKFQKNVKAFKLLSTYGRNVTDSKKLFGEQFFKETGYMGYPGVYLNGSLVFDDHGKHINVLQFSEHFLTNFRKNISDNNLLNKTAFLAEDGSFSLEEINDNGQKFMRKEKMQIPKVVSFQELLTKKIGTILCGYSEFDYENLKKGEDYISKKVTCKAHQLNPPTSNKRKGLEVLLNSKGTDFQNCSYIGDGDNDKEAMEACRESFCVGNATDDVKCSAKTVLLEKHDECAFEKAVNMLREKYSLE